MSETVEGITPAYPIKYRLIARYPFGGPLGRLPAPLSWTYTHVGTQIPTLDVDYSEAAFRGELLGLGRFEVGVQWRDATVSQWQDADNTRLILLGTSRDQKDKNKVVTLRFVGMGYWLTKAEVFDPTSPDVLDGQSLPYRRFNSPTPGDMMSPLWNAAVSRIWTGVVASPPDKTFTSAKDSSNVDWVREFDGRVFFKTTEKLAAVEALLIEHQMAEPAWTGREYGLYNWGTYGRDLTGPDGTVAIALRSVAQAPEDRHWEDIAGRVTVIGKGGRQLIAETTNPEFDTSCGLLEASLEESTIETEADMERAANLALEAGNAGLEQIGREWVGPVGPRPLRDYRPRDQVWLERSNQAVGVGKHWLGRLVTEVSITYQRGKGYKGHAKFSDRHQDRLARKIGRLLRAIEGRDDGGIGGRPEDESAVRKPATPTNVAVTVTLYPGEDGIGKGQQTISWDPVTLGEDGEPIELKGYAIGEKRVGNTIAWVTQVAPAYNQWIRPELVKGDGRTMYVRAISAHGAFSNWSTDVDGTVPVDYDPIGGPNSLVDPYFRSAAIRAQRDNDAGAGFDFTLVSSRYYADFTASGVTLHMARVGPGGQGLRRGRVKVNEGEKWVVGGNFQRIGGTSVSARWQVRSYNAADTGSTDTVATTAATTTDQVGRYLWTAPSGAVEAELILTLTNLVGGATLRMHTPTFERQTSTERMEDDSVLSAKIAASQVIDTKIATGAVTNTKIGSAAVSDPKIGLGAVTNTKIQSAAVTQPKIGPDAVGTAEIIAGVHVDGTLNSGNLDVGTSVLDFAGSGDLTASGGGIVTYDAPSHQMEGNGNLHGAWTYTGSFGPSSRRSTKTDIVEATVAQGEALLRLRPILFRYKPEWLKESQAVHMLVGPAEGAKPGTRTRKRLGKVLDDRHIGLAAEEVEATGVLDEMLVKKEGETVGLETHSAWLYLVPVINEMRQQRAEDRETIAKLQRRLDAVENPT